MTTAREERRRAPSAAWPAETPSQAVGCDGCVRTSPPGKRVARDTEQPVPLAQALCAVFAGALGGHAASLAANSHRLRRVGATENRA